MGGKRGGVGHKKSSRRAPPSPVTAGGVAYIPMELWIGILIRTPAQDIVRFKYVCKAWYELIRSRSFVESHLEHWRSPPVSRILFDLESPPRCDNQRGKTDIFCSSNVYHRGGSVTRPSRLGYHRNCRCHSLLTSHQREELGCGSKELTVLASCDGLVLICYSKQTYYRLLICNPLTGSYKKLLAFRPIDTPSFWAMLRTGSGQNKVCGIGWWDALRVCYILELQIGTKEQPERRKEQPERRWKGLLVPLSDKWTIEATTTKDGKVHWLATKKPSHWADKYYPIKVLSLDILKEEFSASVSAVPRLCEPECRFFPWKGAFYRKIHRNADICSLWVLEDFDTMTWTEYGNFSRIYDPDFLCLSGDDNELVLRSHGVIFVFDLISKEFWGLRIDSRGGSLGRLSVLHTDSLLGCD